METFLIIGLILSLNLSGILAFLLFQEKKNNQISVKYFPEFESHRGFFKKNKTVRIKAQIHNNKKPIGPIYLVSEQRTTEVDKKQINETIRLFSEPLIKAGIKSILPF